MKARLPEGYGGGAGNMQSMMKQAQKMQEDMARVQAKLDETTYEAKAGGGAVSAAVDGTYTVRALHIEREVIDPDDADMLADLVTAAVNEAIRAAKAASETAMGAISGGML
ncbi:MAG: YbaB/EbfC family nucleoid-associated protein [Oscillospiraceae bacterium]|nr:YbaB/EbfC family nucleoid-associated protein [Oscillospiraceae bacterium]